MSSRTVLIVEDERVVARDLEATLTDLGYRVLGIASDANRAVSLARDLTPDLVVMDIMLDGNGDGIDAAAEIRSILSIPVVFLTAYSDVAIIERAKVAEPYGFIVKPYRERELHSTIEIALYRHRMEADVQRLNSIISAIRDVGQLIVRVKDRRELLSRVCARLAEGRGYFHVWVALPDDGGSLSVAASSGLGERLEPLARRLARGELPSCLERAQEEHDMVIVEDPSSSCGDCPLAEGYEGRSALLTPLAHDGETLGYLVVSTPAESISCREEVSLNQEVAGDIALALHAMEADRKETEAREALRSSARRLREAQSVAGMGDWELDLATGRIDWSDEVYRLFERDPRLDPPSQEESLAYYSPDDGERLMDRERRASELGEESTDDYEVRLPSGRTAHHHRIIRVEKDAEGRVTKLYGTVQDVTERKRAEEQRLQLNQRLQHAQKQESLAVLAGGIAHDFNNLLMAILGNADLALSDLSPYAPCRSAVQEIVTASRRAADLARQMLAYSGSGQRTYELIDINELVEEMAHILSVSISKKAVLNYNYADNLPEFEGDPTQIRQVIMNLITNASEAIGDKSGVIAVSTGVQSCDSDYLETVSLDLLAARATPLPEGDYVYLEVADTGCGMGPETRARVFDPFFTTKFTGRGLGMAASLGIVRGHRGAIKVYSEAGKGSTFKVLFPASEDSSVFRCSKVEAEQTTAGWKGSGTVLVVDDDESVRSISKQFLERVGFSVLTATDGREAVEIYGRRASEIVCVILDLTMPHLDGEQAFRELRRMDPDVRAILSSGYSEQDVMQRFLGKGLAGFIQKPYRFGDLIGKVRSILAPDA